ncbi:Serine protease AprX [Phycisphaerae bacterium RAS1]|nr:Serine protease AprX [Phycisphaerae bacterium RAS1]
MSSLSRSRVKSWLTTSAAAAIGLATASYAVEKAALDTSATSSEVIKWRSGTVTTAAQNPAAAAAVLRAAADGDRRHVVMQFTHPVSDALRAQLDRSGVKLQRYLSNNAFFAAVDPAGLDETAVASLSALKLASPVEMPAKLNPLLMADQVPAWSVVAAPKLPADVKDPGAEHGAYDIQDDMIVAIYVMFHDDVNLQAQAIPLVLKYGAAIRSELWTVNALVLELPATAIKPLAAEDGVMWIEPPLPQFIELNDSNRARVGANTAHNPPYSLDGTGVTVLVYDGGQVRTTHQDFGGRAVIGATDTSGLSSHSTHVAGTIGGSGAASAGLRKGMAPNVGIISFGFEQAGGLHEGFLYNDPGDLQADYSSAINTYDAHIANNSIGTNTSTNGFPCAWQGDYGVTDALIDSIVRGSVSGGVPFRIVWANGNERQSTRCQNLPSPFQQYHLTAPPACAKNHIACGALNSNDDSMTSFSSWGPADDGRMKPDISAPGCEVGSDSGVTSCSSSSDTAYASLCGTSMASPTTCGVSALILQDYRNQYPDNGDFRNSTLKVFLAHTAVDLGNPGPDNQFGYGSIRAVAAIDLMRSGNFTEAEVANGSSYNVVVIVSPTDTQLKVTLAWDDPPATPNVIPSLVNDLDLVVTGPGGQRAYPWTLGGLANPAAPAVQTVENHLDNLEQVFVSNPQAGAWQVEIRGTNVPTGPQPFSVAATPFLVNCSSAGTISLNSDKYPCESSATIRVIDCDLNTDDQVIDTVMVTIDSTSEPAGESVLLTETAAESAAFLGSIPLSATNAVGTLQIAHGDTVTATYIDADDGSGGMNLVRTDTGTVDCVGPVITNVQTINIAPRSATVTFNTDEVARGTVRYGTDCGSLTGTVQNNGNTVSHSLDITGLTDNTTYYYAVDAMDSAGNMTTDDNGGQCYTFSTPEIPDYFTELFGSGNDTAGKSFLFVPNGTFEGYTACAVPISTYPTDPTGGTQITTWTPTSDDGYSQITLGGGAQVTLYGVNYSSMFVGTNGYITFVSGDSVYTETVAAHFNFRRVAALFNDLNPGTGGQVSWKQLADRVAVTWNQVPEYATTNQNSFQIVMYFDGRIEINIVSIAATGGLIGLSRGGGTPVDFFMSDFSTYGSCGPRPPSAAGATVNTPAGTPVLIPLPATDDGLPFAAPLTFIVMSLPSMGVLYDPNAGPINSVPYTLVSGGDTVRYGPPGVQSGTVTFDYKANDGGSPPDGGDSNTATVTVNIASPNAPQPVYEFLVDDLPPLGWTYDVDWAFGDPAGLGGDPNNGFTGVNVIGYNLNGAYPNNLTPVRYVKTAAIDCTNMTQVSVQFMRWLGIESASFDHATVDVSNNGTTWTNVFNHTGGTIANPTSWTQFSYDLSAVADNQATVFVRWGMGTTDGSVVFCGWNLDDIRILAVLPSSNLLGDLNCDGEVNILDINAFILAITDPAAYAAAYPDCNINLADCNGDGDENILDINPFITLLGG